MYIIKQSLLFLFLLLATLGTSQEGQIFGRVLFDKTPIAYADVYIEDTTIGTSSDEDGYFILDNIPAGEYSLAVSFIGYRTERTTVNIAKNEAKKMEDIQLIEDVFGLEEVVVTGTMKETFITNSPIKVEVLTAKYLDKNISPTNLTETVALMNGVEEVVACGVCYTNNISINGLEGAYTAVLLDGAPIYGNLAAVYGLNGIPTMIIDRIELIKGPNSTLYGSEAVAGVINIITKNPENQPLFSLETQGTTQGEIYGSAAISPKIGKTKAFIGVDFAHGTPWQDQNNDGFGDVINMDRVSLFSKWANENKSLSIAGKYYYENRRNGVFEFLQGDNHKKLRGNEEIYGESILTKRGELFGSYKLPFDENIKLDFSLSTHNQESYYGSDAYAAEQNIAFGNLIWNKSKGQHDITSGLTLRLQSYDDNTIATSQVIENQLFNKKDEQFIPGVFIQDEWTISDKWTLLSGGRLDNYQAHGLIFSPRFNAKYKPTIWSTLRANFGTGFRVVNLFTEDHAFVTGQREVVITEDLNPERSYNVSLNYNQILNIGATNASLDLTANYTYFTNKINPDYDTPGQIIYANTVGNAITKGVSLNFNQQFRFPLSYNIGWNMQRVTQTELDVNDQFIVSPVEFAPEYSGNFSLNYNWRKQGMNFALTSTLTGPMQLPLTYDLDAQGEPKTTPRPTRSEAYSIHGLQITKSFKDNNMELFGGVQNIFNEIQALSPLTGFNDPNASPGFSEYFDTAYAYGQLHGREFYLGVRWNSGKVKSY